jgi:LPXTG-site transpeptidase (sortase) family protein
MRKRSRIGLIVVVVLVQLLFALTARAEYRPGVPTIVIPALKISTPIKEFPLDGISWAVGDWERGVGHLQGTAWFGSPGNMVLAGHSRLPNGKGGIFRRLDRLGIGSKIVVFDGSAERFYAVTEKRVVSPEDLSVVYPTGDERLTLITCEVASFDPKTNTYGRRVVVIAQPITKPDMLLTEAELIPDEVVKVAAPRLIAGSKPKVTSKRIKRPVQPPPELELPLAFVKVGKVVQP